MQSGGGRCWGLQRSYLGPAVAALKPSRAVVEGRLQCRLDRKRLMEGIRTKSGTGCFREVLGVRCDSGSVCGRWTATARLAAGCAGRGSDDKRALALCCGRWVRDGREGNSRRNGVVCVAHGCGGEEEEEEWTSVAFSSLEEGPDHHASDLERPTRGNAGCYGSEQHALLVAIHFKIISSSAGKNPHAAAAPAQPSGVAAHPKPPLSRARHLTTTRTP